MSVNEVSLWRKLIAVQWILIFGAVVVGIVNIVAVGAGQHTRLAWLIFGGVVFGVLPMFETAREGQPWRLAFLIAQTALLFVCSLATRPFIFTPFFVLLAARASILLSGKILVAAIAILLLAVAVGGEVAVALKAVPLNLHVPVAAQTIGRIEFELSILVTICAVGFLSRNVVSEQQARNRAETLTREMQDMAVELERTRISQDMHDNLGHILTSLCIQLELATELQHEKKPSNWNGL